MVLWPCWPRPGREYRPACSPTCAPTASPWLGFSAFQAKYHSELPDRLTRFINQMDIVPRLPGVGYVHCGAAKTITHGGELQALGAADGVLQLTDQDAPPADAATLERFLTTSSRPMTSLSTMPSSRACSPDGYHGLPTIA